MKKLIGILLLFWASGVFAQNDDCANATVIDFCQITSSSGFAQSTISVGEYLPFNGLIGNNLIAKSIYFKFALSASRRLDVRVKGLPVSTIDNHAGFAIYKATDCNSLNNSTVIGSYPDLNSAAQNLNLSAGTYYVQVVANHLFTNEVSVEIAPKTIDSHDNSISPYFLTHDSPTTGINIDNLSLDCGEVAPAGYEKSFWAKFEIPAGQYAVPFRLWIEGYLGNVKMVLRKNSPTATPIADQKGNTLSNYLYPASAVSYCGLDAGMYYAQVFFPTASSGNFVFFNRAFLQNTPIPTGKSLNTPIPVALNQTQNVVMVCNPTASLSCNLGYKQNSFVSITIPSNGELKLAINFLEGLGEVQLFNASKKKLGTCKPITDGTVLSYCGLAKGNYYARLSFQTAVSNYAITPTHQPNNIGTNFNNALVLADDVPKTVDITCRSLSSPSVCSPTYQKHSFVSVYVSGGGELKWTIDGLAGAGAFQLFNAQRRAVGTCRNITNGTVLSYCGLAAGKYYARLSFPKTTNQYTIKANEYANPTGDKIASPVVLRENDQLKEVSIRTQCLTLDGGEDHFSSLYSKSLIAKIQIPAGQYGNPLNLSLSPQGGNFETKGKVLFRMFEGSLSGNLVTNKAGQSVISAENGAISTEYCQLPAGEYWIQVLFETQADYALNLKASGSITSQSNQYTYNNPYTVPHAQDQSIQFDDYLACQPPDIGNLICVKPKCSTFLQWTQPVDQIVTVNILPDSLKFVIWKKDDPYCNYLTFLTTCGNFSAVLSAGTYMMQIYSETQLDSTPLLAMITVNLRSPILQNPVYTLSFPSVNIGEENKTLANINFDDQINFLTISSLQDPFSCRYANPCTPDETSLVGFDLQGESFVKFTYDRNFTMKLYRGSSLADLQHNNEIYVCGDSTYFCSLQAQKYIMVLYSNFRNISKTIKISAFPVLSSRAPSLAQAQNNNLGLNPVNITLNDQIGCSTQRSEIDNLPTTNAERHVWFTWAIDKAGSFSIKGNYQVYDPNKVRFYLYYSDSSNLVSNFEQLNQYGQGEYNINAHLFYTPCQTRRYYLKVVARPNYAVNIKVDFLANPNVNVGNYMSNAHQISFSAAGTYSVQSEDIACHNLSPATDYNENNPNDPFTAGLSNYKSTWFKIRNQTVDQNMDINLNISHNLSNLEFIRYRILKANSIGTGVIGEGASLTSLNGTNNLGCFTNPYYYVQVITNQAAQGRVTLNVTASHNNGICPRVSPCDIIATTQWTGNLDQDWAKANNWTNGIPTINMNVIIPITSRSPMIKTSVWAANIILQSHLIIENNGKLTLNGNWTNQSSQTEFGGTVEFVGCIKQSIKGSLSRFLNLEVNNVQSLELESSIEIKKLLHLKEGNLISNQNLTILSNDSSTAMVVQKTDGSNGVIGAANVQRYIFGTPNAYVIGSYSYPYGYHYLSSPMQNATPVAVFGSSLICNTNYNTTSEPAYTNPFPNLFMYNESRSGFTHGTPPYRYSAFTAGWEVPNCQEVMIPAKGYNANIAHQSTLNFAGNLNNGSITIPVSRGTTGENRGWNVVGNPYPAPILWSALFNFENNAQFFDNAIYMRIATGKETGTMASYINGISVNGANDTIAIGQGFLVRVKENISLATLKMDNSVRINHYRKASGFREENLKKGLIKLALKNGKQSDETVVYFQHSATENFDEALDALKIMNVDDAFQVSSEPSRLNLYTQAQEKYLVINALPVFETDKSPVIPLSFEISESGKYELERIELAYFSQNTKVYLEDRQTNAFVNLNEKKNYTFSAEAGIYGKRFFLHFSENKLVTSENDISVYPNPVAQSTKIRLVNNYQGHVRLKLFNAQGKEIWHSTEQKNVGTWEYDLLLSDLLQGLYILDIQTLDQKFSKKIIKQ